MARGRTGATPTLGDWAATLLALNVGRWLPGSSVLPPLSHPWHPLRNDETIISRAIGLPEWPVFCLAAAGAVTVVVAIIRQHPRHERLLPFSGLFLGGLLGLFLWMRVLGPALLP